MSETEEASRAGRRRGSRRAKNLAAGSGRNPVEQLPYKQPRIPFPPMKMVSDDEIEAIHEASLTVLKEIGMNVLSEEAKAIFKACKEQGIEREPTRGGHFRYFRAADPKNVVIGSQTPSDYRAERKLVRDLKNKLGFIWPWDKRQARRDAKSASTKYPPTTIEIDAESLRVVHTSDIPEDVHEIVPVAFDPPPPQTVTLAAVVELETKLKEDMNDDPKDSPCDVHIDMIDQVLRAALADDPECKPTVTFSVDARGSIACRLKTSANDNPEPMTGVKASDALKPIVLKARNRLLVQRRRIEETLKILGVNL